MNRYLGAETEGERLERHVNTGRVFNECLESVEVGKKTRSNP